MQNNPQQNPDDADGGSALARRGVLYILSSPSGAGKTTLARRLLAADPDISMSVSVTTRTPRPGEQDGVDYTFVTRERFAELRTQNALLEWARVFDNYYGTPRASANFCRASRARSASCRSRAGREARN